MIDANLVRASACTDWRASLRHVHLFKECAPEEDSMPRTAVDDSRRVNLRLRPEQKATLMRAAALQNTDLTDFVLRNALREAEAVIEAADYLKLSAREGARPPGEPARAERKVADGRKGSAEVGMTIPAWHEGAIAEGHDRSAFGRGNTELKGSLRRCAPRRSCCQFDPRQSGELPIEGDRAHTAMSLADFVQEVVGQVAVRLRDRHRDGRGLFDEDRRAGEQLSEDGDDLADRASIDPVQDPAQLDKDH